MSNNLNPLSKLLDIDFPEIKRSNWNNSFDVATTADVGFVQPVFVDRVMAGTRCQLDFDSASFANSTIAPLYGRYKVKYLAFWAPDRLYMPDWLSGEKMIDDDYPYPYIRSNSSFISTWDAPSTNTINYNHATFAGKPYIPTASLGSYLGIFPALYHPDYFEDAPDKNAFALLAFWDAYRTFMVNPQEKTFPVCTRAFTPAITSDGGYNNINGQDAQYTLVTLENLDTFFKNVKRSTSPCDVIRSFWSLCGFNPLFAPKRTYGTTPVNGYFADDYHYGLPLGTYMPDIYTSWLSNENVELERMKSTVKVNGTVDGTTSTGSFTMEQWYLASRIQKKIRKNLYQFEDFSQWIDTNFGVKPSTTLTQPMFLGAFMSDIVFNDAISTVQQSSDVSDNIENNANLGSRAGYGVGYNGDRRNFFDFTAKEPGTVMILQQIIPEVFYFEGSDKIHEKLNFNEEFNPIFDALGFQDLEKADLNLVPFLADDPTGQRIRAIGSPILSTPFDLYNTAIAQQPYGFEHMGKANRLLGMMTSPNYYQSWSLARSFNYIRGAIENFEYAFGDRLYSSYIVPEMYNNIFANTNGVDNFQFYLSYRYTKYQPVSKQFLSFN